MATDVELTGKSSVETESTYEYSNKYLDEAVVFEPAGDEVVASIPGGARAEGLSALNADDASSIAVVDPHRGFAILEVNSTEAEAALAGAVNAVDPSANLLPVMLDAQGHRRYLMPDELTVQFLDGVDDTQARQIIDEHGSSVVEDHRTAGYYTIAVPEAEGLFETIRHFNALEDVEFAEPSEIGVDDALSVIEDQGSATTTEGTGDAARANDVGNQDLQDFEPDDLNDADDGVLTDEADLDVESLGETFINRLWALRNLGQSVDGVSGLADADIDGTLAWRITMGNSRAVVVVIDTGADLDHPDLKGRLMPQGSHDWDFADPSDTLPTDAGSHGTHVAGTAVATSNRAGVVGVAPRARLIPLRINLTAGMNANRADAINYVADRARRDNVRNYVINCSWRASGNIAAILRAIRRAVAANVLVVFAAGNDNRDMDVNPQYPGAYPEVMSVAASDQRDRRAWFSNYGSTVDVTAPGVNIYSTVPNDTFGYKDGTSMASPHVAGLAALIWSRNETLSAARVRRIIERTCDNIDARNPGFAGKLGGGRINAYRALRATPAPERSARVVRRFAFPQANAGSSTGLAFAPDFRPPLWGRRGPALLFLTQKAGSERVHFLNPTNGATRWSVDPAGNDTVGSLAWADGLVWMANVTTGAGSINKANPFSGAQVGSLPAPTGRGEGLAHDGRHLYYSTQNRIHVLDPSTGSVLRSFVPPGGACRALTSGRGRLFLGNSSTGKITIIDAGTRLPEVVIRAPGSGSAKVEGLAYDSRRRELYVANQSEDTIYVVRV